MKTLLGLLFIMGYVSGFAQSCDVKASGSDVKKMTELKGEWRGEFIEGGITHPIRIVIVEQNGDLKAFISNSGTIPKEETADISLCSERKYHFFGKRLSGDDFRYNLRLVDNQLVGNFQIGLNCSKENRSTFTLRRQRT